MAQLVFVHGVATRNTPAYQQAVFNRNTLFKENVFGSGVEFHAPVWGQHVPPIDSGVFETDKGVSTYSLNVGPPSGLGGGLMGGPTTPGNPDISIGAIGKQDPIAALDAICSEIIDRATQENRPLDVEELHAFRTATNLIASGNAAAAFTADANSQAITAKLKEGAPAAFGIGSKVTDAITKVTDRVKNAASTLGFGAVRDSLSPSIGLFIGDVFVYLKEGDLREKIRNEVRKALVAAHQAAKTGKGPLVLIGHSMGGVILVDMLANPVSAGLPAEFKADALITVGSQPGFFGALDVLTKNVPAGSPRRRPDCVKLWLNVFDPIDPLAFRADMIFTGVEDLTFNSVTGITEAHSKYFQRSQFYARTRNRLKDAGIL